MLTRSWPTKFGIKPEERKAGQSQFGGAARTLPSEYYM